MRNLMIALALSAAPVTAAPLTAELQAQLNANLARGDLLYAYDQAAWHVTDAAIAALPKPAKKELKGYIVTPHAEGYRVTFYGSERGRHYRLHSALWTGREVLQSQSSPVESKIPVTAEEARLIDARLTALSDLRGIALCGKGKANTAVVPGNRPGDPISVYVLSSMTTKGEVPLGGHFRIDVKDGRVVSRRPFTKSCIIYSASQAPAGVQPAAFVITHLLDPIPTEIHAFSLHYMPVPLGVGTPPDGMFILRLKDGRATVRVLQGK